jgi:hypothetical protein
MSRYIEFTDVFGGAFIISDDAAGDFAISTAENGEATSVTLTLADMRRIVAVFPEFATQEPKP